MEVTQLLAIGLAAVLVLIVGMYWRLRNTTWAARPPIIVGDPDVTRRLIFDHADAFSNHPLFPLGIDLDAGHPKTTSITSAPYGPFWRAIRRNLTVNILHPSRVAELLVPLQRDAVDALVADVSSAAARDTVVGVRDAVYAAVFSTVARLCFGEDVGDHHDVRSMQKMLHDFFHDEVGAFDLLTSRWARLVHRGKWRHLLSTRSWLGDAFGPVIASRRLSRGSRSNNDGGGMARSYLDSLLDVRVPGNFDDPGESSNEAPRGLRDDEIIKLVWEFLGASTEAVVAIIEWTMAHLVAKPEVQEKLYLELTAGDHQNGQVSDERLRDTPYLRAVVLETLRLHPPLPMLIRDVGPDGAAAAGIPTPPNGTVARFMFNAEVIGRDPKVWSDPEEFRPERFISGGEAENLSLVPGPKEIKMVPFGAGRRHCPGAGLSMVHIGAIVAALVREFEWAPPEDGGGVDLTDSTALFVKVMASPLRARVTPRVSQS
ncbi:hypothetical protein HU200_063686 [Digitaria exilis]|uniref:Cytochrome P450 n=1 Tax=Digitaria exilis TaxID=1010633 RepID=A0A835A6L5_9POAL|nr:hypothetical protein HU200_063686 [Digitaria exilis]